VFSGPADSLSGVCRSPSAVVSAREPRRLCSGAPDPGKRCCRLDTSKQEKWSGLRFARLTSRVLVVSFLLASVAGAAEGFGGQTKAASAVDRAGVSPPARFQDFRVCAYEAFSKAQSRCMRDQKATPLVSTRFGCSVDYAVRRPGVLRARMSYGGDLVYQFTSRTIYPGRRVRTVFISENLGTTPLPGGSWRCDFSFGAARAGAAFRSAGPTGKVIGASVCPGEETLLYGSRPIRVCRSDESARPLRSTDEIVCSGVYVKARSKALKIQLLSAGTDIAEPLEDIIDAPLWIAWGVFMADPAIGKFAAGDYVCRFSLIGVPVVDKPFQIVSG
jgi:hypothetical protein